jgi:lysophospholipase L1-like esterase
LTTRGTSPGVAFDPLDIASLLRFWDTEDAATNLKTGGVPASDGEAVITATELKSGLSLTSPAGPILDTDGAPNGLRALNYNGSSQYLFTNSNIVPASSTWIGLVKQNSGTNTDRIWDTNASGGRAGFYQRNTGVNPVALRAANDGLSGAEQYVGKWDVMTVINTPTETTIRRNGETLSTGSPSAMTNLRYVEAARGANPPADLFGHISLGPRMIFDGKLGEEDQLKVRQWFYKRYGNLFLGQIICDGNSLTAGTGATGGNTYPAQLAALIGGGQNMDVLARNFGVGGQRTDQMIADAATQIDALYNSERKFNVCVAFETLNYWTALVSGSLGGSYTGRQASDKCLGDYFEYLDARKAAGLKTVAATLQPTTAYSVGTVANESERADINTAIRNGEDHYDALADFAANAYLEDRANYPDGTHLDNAGYGVMAGILKAAIDTII